MPPYWTGSQNHGGASASSARVWVDAFLYDLMRSNIDCLDNLSDGSRLDHLASFDGGFYLQPLAIKDGVNSLCLRDGLSYLGDLSQGRCPRLIAKVIFYRASLPSRQGRPACSVPWN